MFHPIHRYDQLNPAAHRFCRVPRYGRLLASLSGKELSQIINEAQLFYTVYTRIAENPEVATGVLHDGLRQPEFARFGWHNEIPLHGRTYTLWQIRLAMDMLGALAFEIMFGDMHPWDLRDFIAFLRDYMHNIYGYDYEHDLRTYFDPRRIVWDSIDGSLEDIEQFKQSWARRFLASGAYVNVRGKAIAEECIYADWQLLVQANSHVMKYFVFSRTDEESIRFNDVSTQAFLAAYWASRYVHKEDELQRLWSCIPDDWREKRQAYCEFWEFLADMPSCVQGRHDALTSAWSCWQTLLTPIFDKKHPFSPKDDDGNSIRATVLINKAWERMKDTDAGKAFRTEFIAILRGDAGIDKQRVAHQLLEGFRWDKPLCEGFYGETDTGVFVRGCRSEHVVNDCDLNGGEQINPVQSVTLTRFWMHLNCVRNIEFELFESRRAEVREFKYKVKDEELLEHPVVNISFNDAACFAKWLGETKLSNGERVRIELPTEDQWEYICRAGVGGTVFSWDGHYDDNRIKSGYCNFDGRYEWCPGQEEWLLYDEGQFLGRTIPVDGRGLGQNTIGVNRWGFSQCHGNVSEWCVVTNYGTTFDKRLIYHGVLRGGGWDSTGASCRAANRSSYEQREQCGFRLAAIPICQTRSIGGQTVLAQETKTEATAQSR